MPAPRHDRTLHTFDALRGLAALAVVLYHYNALFAPFLNSNGGLAVDLFFMMSGVVLARNYEARFRAGMTSLQFMKIRLIRLYPLYLLGLAIGALAAIGSLFGHDALGWTPRLLAEAIGLALFVLPGPSSLRAGQLFPLDVPAWSLFFELLVNFAFVALWPWLTTRRLAAACLILVPALATIAFCRGDVDAGWLFGTLWIGAIRALFGFSLGIVIARWSSPEAPSPSTAKFVSLIVLTGVALFVQPEVVGRPLWSLAWMVLLFPGIVYAAARVDPPKWLIPLASLAGVASYAIYVTHYPLLQLSVSLIGRLSGGSLASFGPLDGCGLIAAFAIAAWALDGLYDAPVRRRLRALDAAGATSA
jgi:peptidoglycan/LPS O-acetylase OafA/YrhL